ncbi:unnamed protein product [Lathyrus oleraceus]|uniref:Myb-like domain-containing protein n=1 Tax=Pisum sativum TaxID=3888 RepID=A0A9D4XAL1_PEA|nr:trihelix transcription factor ASIL2 [Pisum sativum]KAI5415905.1 hypothetical protein KIW84_041079 [Pisum sativum]
MASSPSNTTLPPLPDPPIAVPLALPAPLPLPPSTRRLPPPCWSPDETLALIDSYRDKWYSLGRGNLKATHWQEVADAVSHRCPNASPAKTPVQCRHKMEKLRKRYRTEIQRARSLPLSRFNSAWVHFKLMDSMEKGPSPVKSENNDSDSPDDDEEEDQDQDLYMDIKNGHGSNTRSINKLYRNGFGGGSGGGGGVGVGGGFRIRFPPAQPESRFPSDQKYNPNLHHNYGTPPPPPAAATKGMGNKRERDPLGEVVSAIKVLGDGFVRMEQMKMEMARDIEAMRMDMEMKRTEMILESQRRIVEAFAKAVSDDNNNGSNHKMKPVNKRIPSPQQP